MGRSGSRSRRDGRFPRAEAATTRPRTRAWQPIYAAPLMELLLVSPRPPSRDWQAVPRGDQCVCVCIKLHITVQSGFVILVILCHSHVCVCIDKNYT